MSLLLEVMDLRRVPRCVAATRTKASDRSTVLSTRRDVSSPHRLCSTLSLSQAAAAPMAGAAAANVPPGASGPAVASGSAASEAVRWV